MTVPDKPPPPTTPTEITTAFLTAVLDRAGALGEATLTAVRVEPLVAPASYNAQLARLHLTYGSPARDADPRQAPWTLIAKLPTADAALHENAGVFRPGAKETWFYRHGAARSPLHTPHCYYSAVHRATGESILLLGVTLILLRPGIFMEWFKLGGPETGKFLWYAIGVGIYFLVYVMQRPRRPLAPASA